MFLYLPAVRNDAVDQRCCPLVVLGVNFVSTHPLLHTQCIANRTYTSGGSSGGGAPPPLQPENYISLLGHTPTTCLTTRLTWIQCLINLVAKLAYMHIFFCLLVHFFPRTSLMRHCLDGWAPPPPPFPASWIRHCIRYVGQEWDS